MGQWLGEIMFPQGLYSMPIPESIKFTMPDDYNEEYFLQRSKENPELKWSLWPRRCRVSNRWIWLTQAYRVRLIIRGPGEPAVWTRWYSSKEMLVLKLKHGV